MLEAGSLVAGKLRIERVLGQGGMGTVCVATHVGLDQRVAIKVLLPELANQPEVVARFVREARASARLKSEHVCRVSDVGQLETGEPYIEMELLEGMDLSKVIEQAPLPVETAADYVLQACIAVAEAHQLGIIHRDLKPANLFITHRMDGTALVKVLDFGIATAPSQTELKITKTTTVMGSPGYMSPEHLRSARDVDARSDIWALGVILYEAVTGRLPFFANTITELAVKVVMDEPEPLGNFDPRYAAIVAKCLAKPPEQRYQSVAELAAALAPLGGVNANASAMLVAKILTGSAQIPAVQSAQIAAASARLAGAAPTMAAPSTQPPAVIGHQTTLHGATGSSTMPPARKRNPAVMAGLAVVLLCGGGVAAFLLTRKADEPAKAILHDAAVAQVASDAGPAIDAVDQRLAELQKIIPALAEAKDWSAILTVATGVDDPSLAPAIADAKQKYLALELEDIRDYAKRGDCASAKAAATHAATLVPSRAAELDKAAMCAPKPKPPVAATIDLANNAYDNADYPQALKLAEEVVAKDPKNTDAVRLAARAACGASNAAKAREYIAKLSVADRKLPLSVCRMNSVELGPIISRPPPPPGTGSGSGVGSGSSAKPPPPPPPPLDVAKELEFAKTAMLSHNYTNAMASAQKVLQVEPTNREAMRMLGISACHLHLDDVVKNLLAKHPPAGVEAAIKRNCGHPIP